MAIIPVLLDERPHYFEGAPAARSLLLAPLPAGTLLEEIAASVARVTSYAPVVLSRFGRHESYQDAIRHACPRIQRVLPSAMLADPLALFDPADILLLVSPRWYPAEGPDVRDFTATACDSTQTVHHLLAFESSSHHTRELVQHGADGRLRRVQRYFEPVTWPFTTGVVASMVPIVCLLQHAEVVPSALPELRQAFSAAGVPSVDVPLHATVYDLGDEEGMLALVHQRVLAPSSASVRPARDPVMQDTRPVSIAPSARCVGAVVVRERAVIEPDALVIGPSLIAPGAHVRRGAVVAQCVIGADVTVPENATVRHRVVNSAEAGRLLDRPHRHNAPPAIAPTAGVPHRSAYQLAKAIAEPPLALIALAVLSPVFLIIGLLVALTSTGPVFYGDVREGRDGRLFRCWKFRTMRVDADALQRTLAAVQEVDGPHFKMENDPRVTTLGRWLRTLTLDELPQIVNVLCGQMSFVGPRPAPFRENQICVPWRRGRLRVRPGMTGLWQVCRHDRSSGDFHQWIEYDLLYVEHASLLVDLKIVLATFIALLLGRPATAGRIVGEHRMHRSRQHATSGDGARGLRDRVARMRIHSAPFDRPTSPLVRAIAGAAILALAPSLGRAQESASSLPPVGERYWTIGIEAGEGYEQNALFQSDHGDGGEMTHVSGNLGAVIRHDRTQFELDASGGTSRYRRALSDLDQFTYGARAAISHAATPRLTVAATALAQTTLSSDIPTGTVDLPLLPRSLSHAQGVTGSASYRLTQLMDVSTDAEYTHTSFNTAMLDGGDAISGGITLRRAYAPASTLGLVYHIERSATAPLTVVTNTVGTEWVRPVGPLLLRTQAGLAGLKTSQFTGWSVQPVGEIALTDRTLTHGEFGTFSAHYARTVGQVFGLGRLMTSDEVGVSVSRVILASISASLTVNQGWSTASSVGVRRIASTSVSTDLRRAFWQGLWGGVGAYYRQRIERGRLAGSGVMLTAGYQTRL